MLHDLAPLLPFALPLLAAGAAAGLLAGLLGIGGGIIVVPVLYQLFGALGVDDQLRIKLAVGTSLATIVVTGWSSAAAHWRRGAVDFGFLRGFGPFIVAGVLAGSALATWVRGPALTGLFAVLALAVALQMAFGSPEWRLGDGLPAGWRRLAIGGAIGTLSAMLGIGGGVLTVPVMTMYGTPARRAVGTSAATGILIGVPGTLGFMVGGWGAPGLPPLSLGHVSLMGFALVAPASVAMAPLGARLATRLDTRALKRLFALFLAITAMRMGWNALGG